MIQEMSVVGREAEGQRRRARLYRVLSATQWPELSESHSQAGALARASERVCAIFNDGINEPASGAGDRTSLFLSRHRRIVARYLLQKLTQKGLGAAREQWAFAEPHQ